MLIPIQLCEYVLANGLENELRVLIAFKYIGNGQLKNDLLNKNKLRHLLDINSIVTLNKYINKLEQLNWIGIDRRRKLINVRGFDKIRINYGLKNRKAVKLKKNDLKNFKGFCTGAFIGSLCITQKRRKWNWEDGSIKRRTFSTSHSTSYFMIAINSLAKILSISISKAHRLKMLAFESKYITVKQRYNKLDILVSEVNRYKNYYPEYGNRLIIQGNEVYEQLIDFIKCNMNFKNRKSISYDIKK